MRPGLRRCLRADFGTAVEASCVLLFGGRARPGLNVLAAWDVLEDANF